MIIIIFVIMILIFAKVNLLSDIVCRYFIEAFRKQFFKPFGLDQDGPEAFLLPRLCCSFFRISFSFYIFLTDNFAFLVFLMAAPI